MLIKSDTFSQMGLSAAAATGVRRAAVCTTRSFNSISRFVSLAILPRSSASYRHPTHKGNRGGSFSILALGIRPHKLAPNRKAHRHPPTASTSSRVVEIWCVPPQPHRPQYHRPNSSYKTHRGWHHSLVGDVPVFQQVVESHSSACDLSSLSLHHQALTRRIVFRQKPL